MILPQTIRRFQPMLTMTAVYLTVAFILRLLLWRAFGVPSGVTAAQLPHILGTGMANDLVEALYVLAPLGLYLFLLPQKLARNRWQQRLFALVTFLVLFGLLYLSAAEYFFFEEFDSRFNLVAVDYLIYPHEVLINLWDSYPVARFILAALVLSLVLIRWFWPAMRESLEQPSRFDDRARVLIMHSALLILAVSFFSTDTLAWSHNRVANELSTNGLSSLFQSFRTNEIDYLAYYKKLDRDKAFSLVRNSLAAEGGHLASPETTDLTRTFTGRDDGERPMNVVVIVEESFGAGFVGAYGDNRGLTPNFDRLSQQGLLFANAYATGTRTVRGLEAITASFPPIPSESIIKRPGNEHIANWGEVMRRNGYQSSFLYGGYGYFDNMNHFYENNGFAISDRTEIPEPTFANIWGVCDEDLFDHALDYFDGLAKEDKPFFSIVMSTSNHKPYTFPAGIDGIPAEGGGRQAGVRYADYALGRFFDKAPGHGWFENTLFVIVADHDARVYGRAQVPVDHYQIPLLFFAPGKIEPSTNAIPTSQIDIAPTVLGLLGLPYSAPFFGQDVLHLPPDAPRPILLNHNHDVAIYLGDELAVLGLHEAAQSFHYDAKSKLLEEIPQDPQLINLAAAYYQTAYDLFKSHRYE